MKHFFFNFRIRNRNRVEVIHQKKMLFTALLICLFYGSEIEATREDLTMLSVDNNLQKITSALTEIRLELKTLNRKPSKKIAK